MGFSIRGGWEHGTGIFVSEVQPGSEAYHQGLRVGDQIIRVNGFTIQHAIHQEVLNLLQTKIGVILTVKRVGVIPVKEKDSDQITWKIIERNSPTSSILESSNSLSSSSSCHSNPSSETKIYIPDCGSSGLGCSVVNGPSEMPGIFVSSIKTNGQADQAGLQIGDQIISANGISFTNHKFAEVISILKSFKELHLIVRKEAGLELFYNDLITRSATRNNNETCIHENSVPREKVNGYSTSNGIIHLNNNVEHNNCTCESEKDFSLTEVEEEAQWMGSTDYRRQNGFLSNTYKKSNSLEDSRLAEEKRKLEEEQRRLEEERERLKQERIRLNEERQKVNHISKDTLPKPNFLTELQMIAEKRCNKERTNIEVIEKPVIENRKFPENIIKRQQHEMLMEEMHVAHRKMFGEGKTPYVNSVKNNSVNNELWNVKTFNRTKPQPQIPIKKQSANPAIEHGHGISDKNSEKIKSEINDCSYQSEDVTVLTFLKDGPLNLKMEGGIYSSLEGIITVGELWEGGFIPLDGRIEVGDQILKFDDTNVENVSLTFANAALRDAMNSSKENLKIIVRKLKKDT